MDGKQLKNSILQWAIQGKLVEQLPKEGSASDLYEKILAEKQALIKAGKLKKEKPLPPISLEDIPFEIPKEWKWCRIGDIFTLQAGKNIASSEIYNSKSKEHQYPCYGGNGRRGYVSTYNRTGHFCIIGRQGALCGNVNFANGTFYATEHAVVVDVYSNVDVSWSGIFLSALNLNQYATATAQPGLAVANINKVLIPLPPIGEQKRIVAKLEKLLPLIDEFSAAQEQLDKLNKELPEALKKSILQEAIQGKLVPQNSKDEPASVLLAKIRKEKESLVKQGKLKKKDLEITPIDDDEIPFEIPDSWTWCRMDQLTAILNGDRGKNYPAKSTLNRKGIPFISALNLDGKSVIEDERLLCLSEEQYNKLGNGKLVKGDIVVCIRGSLGKHGRYPYDRGAIASSLVILRPYYLEDIFADFIMLYLDSPAFYNEIKRFDNGTAQPNLAAESLKQFYIPLPPLAEQKRIIAKLEQLFKVL